METTEPHYTEVTILVHPEAVEGVSDALFSIGATGIVEERLPLHVRVTAYLPADANLEQHIKTIRQRLGALERQGLRLGPGTITQRAVAPQAWSEVWKEQFQVQRIAPGLVIAPSWEGYQPEAGECVVVLDPGAAFGTGGHATTRLCLRLLVAYVKPGDLVADVGCGSGILAITAAMLGAREVIATDNDPGALMVTRQNVRRNRVEEEVKVVEADLLPELHRPFDVIVCNILAEEVIRMAASLRQRLTPGGRFICSGFQATSVATVEDALVKAGLRMVSPTGEEGWAACVAMRPAVGR